MPRLITCIDQHPGEEPVLDSQAYWVRLPDGTRARDGSGKLLAFRSRENAAAEAKAITAFLKDSGIDGCASAIPPEPHEYRGAGIPARQQNPGKNARPTAEEI